MKLFILICIYLFGYSFVNGQRIADSLYSEGEFLEAAIEFEKEAFFSSSVYEKSKFLLWKSYCYKALGDYHKSLSITDRITKFEDDSLRQLVIYERIFLSYFIEDYQLTYNELLKWDLRVAAEDRGVEIYRFLTLVSLGKIEEAKTELTKCRSVFGLGEEEVAHFFSDKWKLKDPNKAYKLSLFLPGIGQMYSGYFFKGVLSGTIQVGLVAFTAYHLYHGYIFTGGMTGAALFYTFYLGGARYASQLAEKKNGEIKEEIKEKFMRLLENKKRQ